MGENIRMPSGKNQKNPGASRLFSIFVNHQPYRERS
jgi:hypothetical protein